MDRKHAGVVATPVRWLHLPGVSGPLNLGLVRGISFGINIQAQAPSCHITMAYNGANGWPVTHTIDDPATISAVRSLIARESAWIYDGALSVTPPD